MYLFHCQHNTTNLRRCLFTGLNERKAARCSKWFPTCRAQYICAHMCLETAARRIITLFLNYFYLTKDFTNFKVRRALITSWAGQHRPNTLLYINKPTAPAGKMFQTSFSRPETLCKERMTLTMGLMHQTPAKQISGNIPKTILPNSCKNGFLQMIYTEMCDASYVELRQEAKINILPALKAN